MVAELSPMPPIAKTVPSPLIAALVPWKTPSDALKPVPISFWNCVYAAPETLDDNSKLAMTMAIMSITVVTGG